ncbi:DUF2270 domain-containing protein [Aquimarina algiphila]|uniref:DUF2270 domain-containing protein n=1 Tax=Aquimarina algiphila TaxID=2047982 RepID=A0A554VCE2_9FLAO|nr:DUF2270 domain-containing protein [Aquimarina algiphila]TSE04361.1 DUF2270 domain-containing protein [Aquimarina algiphila]
MMNDDKLRLDLIEKEYFHLQTEIEKFDDKSLTIKTWSVSLVTAIVGSDILAENTNHYLILFASFASIMFWIIEASWKAFQSAYYCRIKVIEKFMREKDFKIEPLQIATSWSKSHKKINFKKFMSIMFWRQVMIPHGMMSIILLILYLIISIINIMYF